MNRERIHRRRARLALWSAALGLALGCGDRRRADPAPARQSPPAAAPAKEEAEPPGKDWRRWVSEEVQRIRAERPEHIDAVMQLLPQPAENHGLALPGPLLADPDSAPVLLHRLLTRNEPADVRGAIIRALPRTGVDTGAALADLMALETDPRVRALIAEGLATIAAPHAHQGLRRALDDGESRVRLAGLRALGRRDDARALTPELVEALGDPDPRVVSVAAYVAGELSLVEARDPLVPHLAHASAAVRLAALKALASIDPAFTRARPELASLRSDPDPQVAREAERIATAGPE